MTIKVILQEAGAVHCKNGGGCIRKLPAEQHIFENLEEINLFCKEENRYTADSVYLCKIILEELLKQDFSKSSLERIKIIIDTEIRLRKHES